MAELDLIPSDKPNATFTVLKAAATGTLLVSSIAAPNILKVFAHQLKDLKDTKALRAARYARQKGWLTLRDTPEGIEVALTSSGQVRWRQVQLEQPIKKRSWDGKWRLVLFDVPVEKKNNAQVFRDSLKRLGFKQFQKSIWIIPYPCQTEVAALRQLYGLKKYVRIMEVLSVDDELGIRKMFKL